MEAICFIFKIVPTVLLAYHGLKQTNPAVTYAPRYLNLQKVEFNKLGYPIKSQAAGYETDVSYPSGETDFIEE